MKSANINDVFKMIDTKISQNSRIVIAIDGHSAAGKSTLSGIISSAYFEKCSVIHMDDFFLPTHLRTEERLQEIGGNIDYDRFFKEIICHISSQKPFQYGKFSCQTMSVTENITVFPKEITIIEGVYSMHPRFGNYSNIKLFLDIDKKEQSRRILKRNGIEKLNRYLGTWIPMENNYFYKYNIKENSDISLCINKSHDNIS